MITWSGGVCPWRRLGPRPQGGGGGGLAQVLVPVLRPLQTESISYMNNMLDLDRLSDPYPLQEYPGKVPFLLFLLLLFSTLVEIVSDPKYNFLSQFNSEHND